MTRPDRSLRSALALCACVASGLPLVAQTVSPATFYATREGDLSIPYVFSQPSRMQQIHGDLVGAPQLFTGITFRRDGISNGNAHAVVPGKTITLSLVMADSVAIGAATNAFASNATGGVTTVFSGTVSTPPIWATPARSAPAPLDFRLPHAGWVYSGAGAFLWDAATTATSDTVRVNLDAAQSAFPLYSWCSYDMQGFGCATANGVFELRGSGQNLGGLGAYTVKVTGFNAPSSTPCVALVGFGVVNTAIPGLCTSLWPDPVASFTATSDATGKAEPWFQVPSNAAWLGANLEMQMFAPDASLAFPIPVVGTNGLTYRVEPMAPAFSVGAVVTATPTNATGTLLATRAAIVMFD